MYPWKGVVSVVDRSRRDSQFLVLSENPLLWKNSIRLGRSSLAIVQASIAFRLESSSSTRVDRKSTRLNSSHLVISYAVFCLKKKKKRHLFSQIPQSWHRSLSLPFQYVCILPSCLSRCA